MACMNNCLELVNLFLDAGARVNHASPDGVTALMKAVAANSTEIVHTLLNAGADVNAVNKVL